MQYTIKFKETKLKHIIQAQHIPCQRSSTSKETLKNMYEQIVLDYPFKYVASASIIDLNHNYVTSNY